MRMEMESRDSGEQLREMAEKVFQLLERLKLAELAKNKAMEVRPAHQMPLEFRYSCISCLSAIIASCDIGSNLIEAAMLLCRRTRSVLLILSVIV